jgi:hypothetical protein
VSYVLLALVAVGILILPVAFDCEVCEVDAAVEDAAAGR